MLADGSKMCHPRSVSLYGSTACRCSNTLVSKLVSCFYSPGLGFHDIGHPIKASCATDHGRLIHKNCCFFFVCNSSDRRPHNALKTDLGMLGMSMTKLATVASLTPAPSLFSQGGGGERRG